MACAGAGWPLTSDLFSSVASCQQLATKGNLLGPTAGFNGGFLNPGSFIFGIKQFVKVLSVAFVNLRVKISFFFFKSHFLLEPKARLLACAASFYSQRCYFVIRVNSGGFGASTKCYWLVWDKKPLLKYVYLRGMNEAELTDGPYDVPLHSDDNITNVTVLETVCRPGRHIDEK